MNSPEASPTPAPTMPGPTILQMEAGGSGISRISTSGRCLLGSVGVKPSFSCAGDRVLMQQPLLVLL